MIQISYAFIVILISVLWLIIRTVVWTKQKPIEWKRELELLLVYICIIVVTRFTFCPFGKVDGKIQPLVFKKLDTPAKVIAAGVGFSFCIEILQLPFYDRVSDVDDLILNSLGYTIGYGIYAGVKCMKQKN